MRRPRSCRRSGILALALVLASCGDGGANDDGGSTGTKRPGAASARAPLRFTDVTAAAGLTLVNVSGDLKEKMAIPENIGQGAAALDYDGDGLLDLFIANGDVFEGRKPHSDSRCALYRNLGDLRFEDVTAKAGLVFRAWCHGAYAVDFDADGHTDLYLTVYRGPNRFFRNRGDGRFEDVSARWGGGDPGPSTGAAFFDADGDGDLDLYVGNYVDYDPANPPNEGNPCGWKGLQVSCGPRGTTPGIDTFYENRDGTLADASEAFGFHGPGIEPAYTLGVITGDCDNDGDVDLYVANDSVKNYLFINDGTGHFSERALEYGVDMSESGAPQAGMGVDFGDVDNDGRFEFFVTNFSHDHNTLYHNGVTPRGETLFSDTTYSMNLGESSFSYLSWGARIVDLDNDGWQDIVTVSGHVYPQVQNANLGTTYAQYNQIFRSSGATDGALVTFDDVRARSGPGLGKKAVSRGLVTADFDDDGDVDLFVVEMDAAPTLLRNDTPDPGHWIGIGLRGAGRNRDAIGARLEIADAAGVMRYRERTSGASFFSTCDPRFIVGLGAAEGPVEISVRWPDGSKATFAGLATGRYWVLTQGEDAATEAKR